jgi:hypothetical protein
MRAGGSRRYAVGPRGPVLLALTLGLAVLVLGAAPAGAVAAADRGGEKAMRFHVDIVLNRDGSASITENITWQFPAGEERHGIERRVRVRVGYQGRDDAYRLYELSDVSASSPTGAPADVSVTDQGAFDRIRVGDPNETVSGTHSYIVKYRLANYVNGFEDHAEFYYNLIDVSNNNVYENVSATVRGPGPIERADCFYGELGSTTRCTGTPGESATFSAPDAQPRGGVSILASLPRTAFGSLEPRLGEGSVTEDGSVLTQESARALGILSIGAGVTLPLIAVGLMGVLVYTRGRDEQYAGLTPGLTPGRGDAPQVVRGNPETVAVQFNAPEGVQPGLIGTLLDEEANTIDVAATIVDLAVRGHLRMEETEPGFFGKGDWRLIRTTPSAEQAEAPLHPYEEVLLQRLFSGGDTVLLSQLKNHFAVSLRSVQDLMYQEVVRRGWFRRSPQAQRAVWTGLGKFLVIGGIFGAFWLGGGLTALASGSGLGIAPGVVLAVGIIATGAILWFMGKRMAARTADGSAVLAQARGFRQYLVTAEANQIKWEEAQEIFSRYLPYAIVFGVASQWAATFEQVARAAAAAGHTITPPFWYLGSGDFGSFSNIASGMDSFATTAGGTFTSTPGSSGSSGFSSGGGFSGGGGGGSSGGSW